MKITARQLLLQYAHTLQQDLFPRLYEAVGPLSPQLELLASIATLAPVHRLVSARRAPTGRPAKDRTALALAFIAKAILNLPTTRDLIDRLRIDPALRRLCGWRSATGVPHESKFSRAFAEFAASGLARQLHDDVIHHTQQSRLVGHIARDSTAIPVRERFPLTLAQQRERKKASKRSKRGKYAKGPQPRSKASERGTRIQRQRRQSLEVMLTQLPCECDLGVKTSHQGDQQYWRGYKLHLDVADGQIPISAVLTSASLHDSQVAIPLMTQTSQRVDYLYDLMDSAYDSDEIHAHSRQLQHVPIIAVHPRRGTKKPSPLHKVFPPKLAPQLSWAQQDRFKERTMVERVYARLKDEFGASQIRVRGGQKVMAHLMFGVLALTFDQWLRLSG